MNTTKHDIPERLADQVFDNLNIPRECLAVRDKVRRFAENTLRPQAHDLNNTPECTETFRYDLVKDIADAGLFSIPFAKEFGGDGLEHPTLATMIMLEEMAYISSGVAAALIDVQLILFGFTLTHAQEPLRNSLFKQMIAGDIVGAFATSEPRASTDLSVKALQTTAKKIDGGYVVNGQKRWITNAPIAGHMAVLCKQDKAMTMLMVDMSAKGVRVGEPDRKMGNHFQLTADVHFNEVFIPDGALIGTEGAGLRAALTSLTLGRVGIGACGVGMGQAAFDFAVDYMKKRHVFGKPIAQFQYWQFKFADYAVRIENARNLYVKAALAVEAKRPNAHALCAMAKLDGSALAVELARDAIQVCGGYGFVKEVAETGRQFPLEAIYRDSKIGEIYEGANEVQRMIIARTIFGRDFET